MVIPNPDFAAIPAGTTTTKSVVFETNGAQGMEVVINISAQTGNLTVAVNGLSAEGVSYNILTSTALSAVAATVLRIDPNLTASANTIAKDVVPENVQIVATVAGGTVTYGIDVELTA